MGLFDRPVRNGADRMFDFNGDGVLDPSEMDAQEAFLHDVDSFDDIIREDEEDDDFEDEDDWDLDEDDDDLDGDDW